MHKYINEYGNCAPLLLEVLCSYSKTQILRCILNHSLLKSLVVMFTREGI